MCVLAHTTNPTLCAGVCQQLHILKEAYAHAQEKNLRQRRQRRQRRRLESEHTNIQDGYHDGKRSMLSTDKVTIHIDDMLKEGLVYVREHAQKALILNTFPYWMHTYSQMFFYNLEPPIKLLNMLYKNPSESPYATLVSEKAASTDNSHLRSKPNIKPKPSPHFFQVDAALRVEYRDEALKELLRRKPSLVSYVPESIPTENKAQGREKHQGAELEISCDVAWEIYEHFKQDFVCLGYEMPAVCLKQTCLKT